jgi:hypothetical protein
MQEATSNRVRQPQQQIPRLPTATSDLLQSLQKITNIVYLTKLDAGDKVKVRNYMNDAERELRLLKHVVMKLATPNSPQLAN